ncbi:conjugative transposon protein TraM [Mucilaginibacter sp. 21P]|nr:conjugative transposon protein TraM [Mucilaginibacter sp. 21P]
MAFWALGGGKTQNTLKTVVRGLDTDLPEAQFKSKEKTDKMAVYQASQRDAATDGLSPEFLNSVGFDRTPAQRADTVSLADDPAERIQAKLNRLNEQLSQPQPVQQPASRDDETEPARVRQLKKMMRNMNSASSAPDPEMQQLNRMLDKIQAIQDPASVRPKVATKESSRPFRAIPAMIDGKQKVANGASVKLKLTDTATIRNQLLPKGQEIFGSCQIINQRLLLTIQNIRLEKQIIPVNLTVFSLDGMPGIPAPEAELSDAAGGGADDIVQSMQILSMDQSIGAQAAAGGINAAKGLFSKKIKKIKVKLKDEQPVLLKINR